MDFTPVTTEDEKYRLAFSVQHTRSAAWSNLRFERALIKRFSSKGNLVELETDDGELYTDIRVLTTLEELLFKLGELEKVQDVPCLLIYRAIPTDGFVLIGEMSPATEPQGSRTVNEPFYL